MSSASSSSSSTLRHGVWVPPDSFDVHECFYPRTVNSTLHPMVACFMGLGNDRIVDRFCHLNPSVDAAALRKILSTIPRFFRWSGADLFNVTNAKGKRQMIVVETNCLDENMQVLTEEGWMFREEMKNRLMKMESNENEMDVAVSVNNIDNQERSQRQQRSPLRVACYNHKDGCIEFHPISMDQFIEQETSNEQVMVDIECSDEAGIDGCGTGISLSVTANHDLFVCDGQRKSRGGGEIPEVDVSSHVQWRKRADGSDLFSKRTAGEVMKNPDLTVTMPVCAPNGHRIHAKTGAGQTEITPGHGNDAPNVLPFGSDIGLHNEAHVDAFLQLYGYWVGCGCPVSADNGAVEFQVQDSMDTERLMRLLENSGMEQSRDYTIVGSTITVHNDGWLKYFMASASDEVRGVDVNPLARWVWQRLEKDHLRSILRGLCMSNTRSTFDEGKMFLSYEDVELREEVQRLCLLAGYTATFRAVADDMSFMPFPPTSDTDIAVPQQKPHGWLIFFSDDVASTRPVLDVHRHFKRRSLPGKSKVWCVTVPQEDQLIFVRKVHAMLPSKDDSDVSEESGAHSPKRPIVLSASRPIIVGNSCPSGQKSMPTSGEDAEAGYHTLMRTAFQTLLDDRVKEYEAKGMPLPEGRLAVIYDKNPMEAKGYAAAMADVFHEPVLLAELYIAEKDPDPPVKWIDDQMHVRDADGKWLPIRAAFRYVTQRPWDRIPMGSKTLVLNSVLVCLAGGRNKMAADKAYEFLNRELAETGLEIRTPETIRDVSKSEIPLWVKSMGGHAVVKIPYSNAGQGVYTITSPEELQRFMDAESRYDKYIVQSLVGNATWSSIQRGSALFHAGTIPNKKRQTFVSDLRCMVSCSEKGFQPLAVYARRALLPLVTTLPANGPVDSWGMLGTNLSIKKPSGEWETDTSRLLLMDMKDFNRLGIAIDDLIDAYVQTCLATLAIDRMAQRLVKKDGSFDRKLYGSLNQDEGLLREIMGDVHETEDEEEVEPDEQHDANATTHQHSHHHSTPVQAASAGPSSTAPAAPTQHDSTVPAGAGAGAGAGAAPAVATATATATTTATATATATGTACKPPRKSRPQDVSQVILPSPVK